MSKFDFEIVKHEVTFKTPSIRARRNFDTIEQAIEFAKSVKEREPIIYEKRRLIIDLESQ